MKLDNEAQLHRENWQKRINANETIIGHYTHEPLSIKESVRCGAMLPCLPSYMIETIVDKPGFESAKRISYIAYSQCERNCNTCKHLVRQYFKCSAGFLKGNCKLTNKNIKFHPHDPMHMECYEDRNSVDSLKK